MGEGTVSADSKVEPRRFPEKGDPFGGRNIPYLITTANRAYLQILGLLDAATEKPKKARARNSRLAYSPGKEGRTDISSALSNIFLKVPPGMKEKSPQNRGNARNGQYTTQGEYDAHGSRGSARQA